METELKKRINDLCEGNVAFDVPMSKHTSMRVGGPADCLAFPPSVRHLALLVKFLSERGIPFFPGGNWSNVIVRDGGFRGVLIGLNRLQGIRPLPEREGRGFYVEAGVSLKKLVHLTAEEGMTGLEFAAGIPGSVGGAIKMNAGAWGKEMKDVLGAVTLIDGRGRSIEVPAREMPFSYRALRLKDSEVIAQASFVLAPGEREQIFRRIGEILQERKARHPLEYPSAGSIFKNPLSRPAGRLIEEAGLKGRQVGGARVSEKHANFIVNTGTATASDVIKLINIVRREVEKTHGISLETEVVIIGEGALQEEDFEHI